MQSYLSNVVGNQIKQSVVAQENKQKKPFNYANPSIDSNDKIKIEDIDQNSPTNTKRIPTEQENEDHS